uniref:Uncharacterized protein n=1 Tax=Arundo donax TaxID=35708 RepID=A0A0A8YQ47_ARUDO
MLECRLGILFTSKLCSLFENSHMFYKTSLCCIWYISLLTC